MSRLIIVSNFKENTSYILWMQQFIQEHPLQSKILAVLEEERYAASMPCRRTEVCSIARNVIMLLFLSTLFLIHLRQRLICGIL